MFLPPHCVTQRVLRYYISSICRTYYTSPVKLILVATSISNYKLQPLRNCIEHVVSKSLDSYQTGKGLKSNLQWRRGMAVNCIQHFNKSSESTIINNSVQPVFVAIKSLSTYTDLQIPSLSLSLHCENYSSSEIFGFIFVAITISGCAPQLRPIGSIIIGL